MAWVGSTFGLQPEMVPSSVANKNWAEPEAPFLETTKPEPLLKAVPVGVALVPAGLPLGGGMVTTRGEPGGAIWPLASYSVETPEPLSAAQKKPVLVFKARPHGLIKF